MGIKGRISSMLIRKGESEICLEHGSSQRLIENSRFGWTNASYIHGLSLLGLHAKRALGVLAPYEVYAKAVKGN